MFFYLCADVTVLEYFCGNLSLGIPSYRQVVDANPQSKHISKTIFTQKTIDAEPSSKNDRETNIPFDADDCFCCSSHSTISYNYLVVSLIPVVIRQQRKAVFSNPQDHSDWHLPPSFRPPRIA